MDRRSDLSQGGTLPEPRSWFTKRQPADGRLSQWFGTRRTRPTQSRKPEFPRPNIVGYLLRDDMIEEICAGYNSPRQVQRLDPWSQFQNRFFKRFASTETLDCPATRLKPEQLRYRLETDSDLRFQLATILAAHLDSESIARRNELTHDPNAWLNRMTEVPDLDPRDLCEEQKAAMIYELSGTVRRLYIAG